MKITEIKVGIVEAPLITPFKTALRTVHTIQNVLVKVYTDDGQVGYGEAAPTHVITGETRASIQYAIEQVIAPLITGIEIGEMAVLSEKIDHCIYQNTSAKAAVEMALYDLWAKKYNAPLYKLLGGYRQELTTDITISVNDSDEMVKDSLEAVKRGFSILKVKVGKDPIGDVDRVLAIRKAVGQDIILRVDANQGWTPKEAVRIIGQLEDQNAQIELVEQPVHYSDIAGMQYVTNHTQTNILADESVFSPKQALEVIEKRAADFINIKLMKTGGISKAQMICNIAEASGIACMIGCMLETKISVSAAAHFAAANKNITMVDLDGPSLCVRDPIEGGPRFEGQLIQMGDTPGLGFLI
ncbi:dipeptide epimerase [Lysinibacillus sp. 2017]|uniref:dipeptide epimerase n=1 Tax=unclassified Lysinibacillus TaxID=2636778 RepID=UPI000D529F74|nr:MULTISPECIES: dipeptide epimerase [unclassified Lysinibacillus]AWE08065.1 dipeptide epimerase [Lysinibacillus sp. 2017]TGN36430.1 dipeptide epimerase [Lysinibacillus sp. S2017]